MKVRKLHLITEEETERVFGSREFISRTRNPALRAPVRFEPTIKRAGDVIL
jgi:hypothetical protein